MMLGWLFGVILILIVIVVWYFSQRESNFPSNTGRKDTARKVLDKRFARGEISKEEYRVARQALRRAKEN
jgi:uncharacterized membrane protein